MCILSASTTPCTVEKKISMPTELSLIMSFNKILPIFSNIDEKLLKERLQRNLTKSWIIGSSLKKFTWQGKSLTTQIKKKKVQTT
jgi:hypothetical protein